jgi:hypothetical protein
VPGGPQRMTEVSRSDSMRVRSGRPRGQQVRLAHDLVEGAGPQPACLEALAGRSGEQIVGHHVEG